MVNFTKPLCINKLYSWKVTLGGKKSRREVNDISPGQRQDEHLYLSEEVQSIPSAVNGLFTATTTQGGWETAVHVLKR